MESQTGGHRKNEESPTTVERVLPDARTGSAEARLSAVPSRARIGMIDSETDDLCTCIGRVCFLGRHT